MTRRSLLLLSVVFLLGASTVMGASSQDVAAYEWTKVFDGQDAYWARRAGLQVVELRNDFYLMGGRTPLDPNIPFASIIWADVWRSGDRGVSWELIADQQWPARAYFQAVSKGGHMYVLGGQDFGLFGSPSTFFNDVWRSNDGVDWEQMTADAGWAGRAGFSAVVFKGEIYVLGGSQGDDIATGGSGRTFFNDVWKSSDGRSWEMVTDAAPWEPRAGASALVKDGYIYLLGGEEGFVCEPLPFCDPPYFNDVWRSRDGFVWELVTPFAEWSKRPGHQCQVLINNIVCFGGFGLLENPMDVWVSRDGYDWEQVSDSPWNAETPDDIKWDFDALAVEGGKGGGRPAIYTFGGDRERFGLPPQINFFRVDDEVWRFAPPGK
jgi:hypothetical protein